MASFSLKLPAQAAVVAASGLTLTGCMSMGGNSSAHAPAPVSNPCGTTTCSAPEPAPKKGLLGLCSHDKNREGLLAKLTGHNKNQQPANGSPVPLGPGEFIVSYNQGPPPMYAAPACPAPACSTPVSACPPEPCFSSGGLMPSISSIMPAPSAPCAAPPSSSTVVPNAVLPPAPVTGQPPLAPSTVAPPAGAPGMTPGGTPQAQPQPAPGTTTSKSFLR